MIYVIIGAILVIMLWVAVSSSHKKDDASLPSLKNGQTNRSKKTGDLRDDIAKAVNENPARAAGSLRDMMNDLQSEKKKR